jgi:hypothetical protein
MEHVRVDADSGWSRRNVRKQVNQLWRSLLGIPPDKRRERCLGWLCKRFRPLEGSCIPATVSSIPGELQFITPSRDPNRSEDSFASAILYILAKSKAPPSITYLRNRSTSFGSARASAQAAISSRNTIFPPPSPPAGRIFEHDRIWFWRPSRALAAGWRRLISSARGRSCGHAGTPARKTRSCSSVRAPFPPHKLW